MTGDPAPPRTASTLTLRPVELLVVAAGALLVLLIIFNYATERSGLEKDDTRHYVQMARDPDYLPRVPYTFRVLTPAIVRVLPLDTMAAFAFVTVSALWLTTLALYCYTRSLGLASWPSLCASVLFLGSGATIRLLTTPTYVDGIGYLTEVAALLALQLRRERLFLTVMLIGVLNRETMLLLIPVYLWQCRAEGKSSGARVALVALAPVVLLCLVVAARLAVGGMLESSLEALQTKPRTFEQTLPTLPELADIYSVFGFAWVLAVLHLRHAPPLVRRSMIFGFLVILQLTVSRGDESRNLSHLLPIVLPLAAMEFAVQSRRAGLMLLCGCLMSMVSARWTLLPNAALRYASVASGSALSLSMTARRRLGGRGH